MFIKMKRYCTFAGFLWIKHICRNYPVQYIISKGAEGFGKVCQDISWVYLRSMMPVDSEDSEAAHDWHGASVKTIDI